MSFLSDLEAAQNGSREALDTILAAFCAYLGAIAAREMPRHLHGHHRPSSLVQQTYLRACKNIRQFEGQTAEQLRAWLRRILLNCITTHLSRERPSQELPSDLAGRESAPGYQAADRERAEELTRALERLPALDRRAIELRYFDQLSLVQVGRVLDCSGEAARKRVDRTLLRLGKELEAWS